MRSQRRAGRLGAFLSARAIGAVALAASALLVAASGCTLVAGVEDIDYAPEPETTTDPTLPPERAPHVSPARDASLPPDVDAGTDDDDDDDDVPADAGRDAGKDAGTDAGKDAGPKPEPPIVDDPVGVGACTAADFRENDRRATGASRRITWLVLPGLPVGQYSPRCMIIRPGQQVTWQGDLAAAPLHARSNQPANPIEPVSAGSSTTVRFDVAGRYRYGSTASPLLRGSIEVRP